jgi:hypothetical protein
MRARMQLIVFIPRKSKPLPNSSVTAEASFAAETPGEIRDSSLAGLAVGRNTR